MARTPVLRNPIGRVRVVATVVLLTGMVALPAASEGPSTTPPEVVAWAVGRPHAIAAPGGHARFTVPTPRAGSRTLVVVSTLAQSSDTFPVRIAARGVEPKRCRMPDTEPETSRRAAQLATPTLPPVSPPPATTPPGERTFQLMVRDGDVASASNYTAVRGRLGAFGRRVQVYVDAADAETLAPGVLSELVEAFDDQVFPVASRTFGQARDVDRDGRFTVLVSGWLSRLAGGRHAVDGFVRGADFAPGLPEPFSNHCDMMYLSASLEPGPHLRTVVAHEYTHAVSFCARSFPAPGTGTPVAEEEGWLDEAAAHLAEDLHGFSRTNLDYRVSAFLSQPERYRLVVDDYYAADLFRSHGNRGATYLFLRWCADRFGPGLLPALIASQRRGVENLEAVTGWSFAELYRTWSLALYTTGFDPSRKSPDGFRSLVPRGPFDDWDLAGPRTVSVKPGAGFEVWPSVGTASRYVVVEASPTGAVEVEVSAPAESELQVTALTLPATLARLDLTVEKATCPGGEPAIRVRLRETNGTPVRLSSLSWEPLVPAADPHAPGFRRGGLDSLGIASVCGTSTLAARGRLDSRPIPAAEALAAGVPIVVKAVGTDDRGRRVAAWADLTPGDGGALARVRLARP